MHKSRSFWHRRIEHDLKSEKRKAKSEKARLAFSAISVVCFGAAAAAAFGLWHHAASNSSGIWITDARLASPASASIDEGAEMRVTFINVSPFSREFSLMPAGCSPIQQTSTVHPFGISTMSVKAAWNRQTNSFDAGIGSGVGYREISIPAGRLVGSSATLEASAQ